MQAWAAGGIQLKSISTGTQYVTPDSIFFVKNSKCAGLAQEIGLSAPNSCSLPGHICSSGYSFIGGVAKNTAKINI
jgi:hypothetical protein